MDNLTPPTSRRRADEPETMGAAGFAPVENLDFGRALQLLNLGQRVARAGWNGRGMFIEKQTPDAHSKMTLPYIFMRTVQGDLVPWLASQTDLLASDWMVVSERTVLVYGYGR